MRTPAGHSRHCGHTATRRASRGLSNKAITKVGKFWPETHTHKHMNEHTHTYTHTLNTIVGCNLRAIVQSEGNRTT